MNQDVFINEVNRIFKIVFFQKLIHLLLRGAWVSGAVYLLFWGSNQLWGWFPNQLTWNLGAIFVFLLVFGSVFFSSKLTHAFVWRLDRGYILQEQVYTLFEVLQDGIQTEDENEVIKALLESDDIAQLSKIRQDIVSTGWRMREEVEATVVVMILLIIVYVSSVSNIVRIPINGGVGILPAIGVDPSADQIFADGIPGNAGNGDGGLSGSMGSADLLNAHLDFSPMEWEQITLSMHELGERLSNESITYKLGHALVQDDYQEAANQLGTLAENSDKLSFDVQQWLASHFLETAVSLQNIKQSGISNYFQEASAALYDGTTSRVSEEMDDLSELMEIFSRFQAKEMLADQLSDPVNTAQQSLEQYQNNSL
ncbi:MAG: hypothetical protein GWN62_11485, partial [Aliifodinibius sp.]|nr:hypothetical protein [Fodinibius sp.]